MSWLRGMLKQARAAVRQKETERDLEDEFRFHLEMETDKHVAEGMSREAAEREALRRFGGVQRHKENVRSARWTGMVQDFVADLRFAIRGLRRQPGFAAAMIGTLSLGIAASLTVFAALDAVLLRPLPFADPDRVVQVMRRLESGITLLQFDASVARGVEERADAFESVGLTARLDMTLGEGETPRNARVYAVTPSFFGMLGRRPRLGRGFLPSDAVPGAEPTVVLTDEVWATLGRDPAILGREVQLDQTSYRVIGVLPPDFRYPTRFAGQVFIPLDETNHAAGQDPGRLSILGRIRPGLTTAGASDRVEAMVAGLLEQQGDSAEWSATVIPAGAHRANPNVERALWTATGAVALMLLVAIMDAINLLLTRLGGRARELAVRHALGARHGRLLRHLMTESLVLSVLAGGVATLAANAGVGFLNRTAPAALTTLAARRIVLDQRVLGMGFGLTILVGLVLGLIPALLAIRAARRSTATSITPYGATTRAKGRLRGGLLVGQVALTMTLLAGAGLLGMSFYRLMRVDLGYDTENLAFLEINPNARFYPTAAARRAFAETVGERLRSLPGVTAVSSAYPPVATGIYFGLGLQREDEPDPRPDQPELLSSVPVPAGYLPTLRAPLLAGRNFEKEDPANTTAIIDPDLAEFLFGETAPLGRRFRTDADAPWLTVVGVADLVLGPPDGSLGTMALLTFSGEGSAISQYSIRSETDIEPLLPLIREAVRAVDPSQPIYSLMTAREAVVDQVATQRFFLVVVAVLATAALALVAAGLYGVLSVGVTQRRRELGIRMALGARAEALQRMVLGHGLTLALVGIGVGVGGALAAGRIIRSLLFEVPPNDPWTLATVSCAMLGVAAAACFFPARRATRVDPVEVLRTE